MINFALENMKLLHKTPNYKCSSSNIKEAHHKEAHHISDYLKIVLMSFLNI